MAVGSVYTTRVIYRTNKGRDGGGVVIAVLLDVPANPGRIVCYEHIGQHSEGQWFAIVSQTRPATPEEYAPLHQELTKLVGYQLVVRKRRSGQTRQRMQARAQLCNVGAPESYRCTLPKGHTGGHRDTR